MQFIRSSLALAAAFAVAGVSAVPSPAAPISKRCTNSATDRTCWGDYDISTNYYDEVPDTGVTVEVCVIIYVLGLVTNGT